MNQDKQETIRKLDLAKLTDDQIKHIAKLASNDDFDFSDCLIERGNTRIKVSEWLSNTGHMQEVRISNHGGVFRANYSQERGVLLARYVHNIIELGKYLEENAK